MSYAIQASQDKNKIKLKIDRISTGDKAVTMCLVGFFVILMLGSYFEPFASEGIVYLGFALAAISATIAVILHVETRKTLNREVLFYLIILALYFMSIQYNHNSQISYLLWNLKYIFAALALSRVCLWHWPVRISFWGFFLYFVSTMFFNIEIDLIAIHVSRNIISLHMLLLCILYIIALKDKYVNRIWVPAIATSFISVWCGSRSGMLSSAILTIGVYFWMFAYNKKSGKLKVLIKRSLLVFISSLFAVGVATFLVVRSEQIDRIVYVYRRTQMRGFSIFDDARIKFIIDYIRHCDSLGKLIFGVQFSSVPSIFSASNNPHNSYIFAHGNYGLLFLLLVFWKIFQSLYRYARSKNIYFLLLAALAVRSFSDIPSFHGMYDPLFFYFIYEYFLLYQTTLIKKEKLGDARNLVLDFQG